ncbi:MAG: DUF1501 domain-containing protein [Planctomycetes bacterium]|nr:DUF1501 domain-containing protein [Planctomycetota bacterium]
MTKQDTITRRLFFDNAATGLGGAALAWMLQNGDTARAEQPATTPPHLPAKARRVIHIFSPGGVSQVDTFDHKPELEKLDGKPLTGKGTLDTFFGRPGNLRKSYYKFAQHGECARWVSELFPHLSRCVDDMAFVHSMVTKSSSHTPACFQMNTGFTMNGFPSLGAWLSYGLGSDNEELPTFVVLPDPRGLPNGASNNWSQGFLPAQHQGVAFRTSGDSPISNLATPSSVSPESRSAGLATLLEINRQFAESNPEYDALVARVRSYELAARMQSSIPQAVDFADETEQTRQLYGVDDPVIGASARNYLLARRLVERGVRFVQIYNGGALGSPRINWDAHEDLRRNHDNQGIHLDQPCAALLKDLKRSGLLEDTLVVWSSEFGRTPFTEVKGSGLGRDHHPHVFTTWMAGAGVNAGTSYGESDEVGYQVAANPVTVYDFHATILQLLGIDHEALTFYHNGINRRLTDVHGHVVTELLA